VTLEPRYRRYDTAITREFLASALYVALVLLAALATIPATRVQDRVHAIGLMLGTALGLTLAHWFAFRLASGLSDESGQISKHAGQEALAQVAGGMTIAVLAAIPYLFVSGKTAWSISGFILTGLLALTGVAIGRLRGWSWVWTLIAAAVVLAAGAAIALVKAILVH
jgi:hypothetical protein